MGPCRGAIAQFSLTGPLHWLGMVDIAADGADGKPVFRLTERALAWLADQPPSEEEVRVPLVVQPEATLLVPHNASRLDRFQAARIAEALPVGEDRLYPYRITPSSLALAQEQGISVKRVMDFLAKTSGRPIPASVRRSIDRWAENGVEGRLQQVVVLRVSDPDILEKLRSNPKTRSYIGESLGDLAVAIRSGEWQAFREATAMLGLLLDDDGTLTN
ncbi:MAG: helicase-associated domain-containing protein [Chloroflexota bacterium]